VPGGEGPRVAPAAARLTVAATRLLLPPPEQDRYGEEFWSEPSDLATAGAGRRAQLAHAARVAADAAAMRPALRALARCGEVP